MPRMFLFLSDSLFCPFAGRGKMRREKKKKRMGKTIHCHSHQKLTAADANTKKSTKKSCISNQPISLAAKETFSYGILLTCEGARFAKYSLGNFRLFFTIEQRENRRNHAVARKKKDLCRKKNLSEARMPRGLTNIKLATP